MHLTSKQATEQYKVSLRTLRTLTGGLTAEQRQKYLLIKGKNHLISTDLLNQHYQKRTGAKVQKEPAKVQQSTTTQPDAPPSHTTNELKQVQSEAAKMQSDLIAHLQNEIALLHDRLKEANFIAANLSRQQIAPPPATDAQPSTGYSTSAYFVWLVVGFICGILVVGVVVFFSL
jgi:hypothetical protein